MENNNMKLDEVMEDDLAGSEEAPSGRILVKLKLPKTATGEEEASAAAGYDGGELKKHYCTECDRSFSSGKALGGHMSSAHVQASRDQSMKKLKSKMKSNRRAAAAAGEEIVCSECGKGFSSMKALFGHMRCHPERNYRGMNSPIKQKIGLQIASENPNSPKLGIGSEPLDTAAEDRGLKTNWSRRGKRGRAQSVSSAEEEEVFHALIMLHRGDFLTQQTNDREENDNSSTSKKPRVSSEEEEEEEEEAKKEEEDAAIDEGKNDNKKSKTPLLLENENSSQIGSLSDDEICLSAMVELSNGPRIEEAPILILNPNPNPNPTPTPELGVKSPPISPEKYTCNICNRSFPTHQALGGHRSSHKKFKMSIVNTEDKIKESGNGIVIKNSSATATAAGGGSPEGGSDNDGDGEVPGEKLSSLHVCKICNKGFASGQALGGHMRSHFEEGSSVKSSSAMQKVVLAFDLNKMPEEEEED